VGGKNLFACVDGPEFNAHEVDFASLTDRLTAYREHERAIWEQLKGDKDHQCKLEAAMAEARAQ
jgi:ferredoxin--NADP+ reductase